MSLKDARKANRELNSKLKTLVKEFQQGYSISSHGQIQGKYNLKEISRLLESDCSSSGKGADTNNDDGESEGFSGLKHIKVDLDGDYEKYDVAAL